MYEQFGVAGLIAFQKTVAYCKEKGLVVIGDVKRGDIGSTSEAYAVAHLGKVVVGEKSYAPFDEDFATVNPYLGSDGINPFIRSAKKKIRAFFVLVKTSNPSSGEFQDRLVDGRPLYEIVGEKVAEWGSECMGSEYSNVGAVVGATYPEMGKALRKVMPKSYILVPGYGAQGGKGAGSGALFSMKTDLARLSTLPRGIIAAYQQEKYAQFGAANYADASRQAVIDMREDIAAGTSSCIGTQINVNVNQNIEKSGGSCQVSGASAFYVIGKLRPMSPASARTISGGEEGGRLRNPPTDVKIVCDADRQAATFIVRIEHAGMDKSKKRNIINEMQ